MTIPTRNHKGLSLLELLAVVVMIGLLAALLLSALAKAKQSSLRSACVNNLKQLGQVLHLYSNENKERFPPVANTYNRFMFDADCVYPEYLKDPDILGCPSDPDFREGRSFRLTTNTFLSDGVWGAVAHPFGAGTAHPRCMDTTSYLYTGWMITDDREMAAMFDIYTWMDSILPISNPATDGWRDRDIEVSSFGYSGSGNPVDDAIHRLSYGVESFLITDINHLGTTQHYGSIVPIMWDQISTNLAEFNHKPAGQNVLYLDGHVEYFPYGKTTMGFPASPLYAAVNSRMKDKRYEFCFAP